MSKTLNNLFVEYTPEQQALIAKRNQLLDQQECLRVHHYRTSETVLTDEDRTYDAIQKEIDKINAAIKA